MEDTDDSPVPDYANLIRLDGKRFLAAGAGRGIGRQCAHALAAAGAEVICADIDASRAAQVANEVGGQAWCGDVSRRPEVQRLLDEAIEAQGGLDGFVDIVGMAQWAALSELDDASWERQFDLCLRHAYLLGQLLQPVLAARGGGTMVFIASVSGITSAPHHAAYGAAKAGLISLMKSFCVELGPQGIRANAIAPGVVNTPRVLALTSTEQQRANASNAPLQRIATPADIAAAALFLSSPLSAYVSGQTLVVDGGVCAKFPFPTTL